VCELFHTAAIGGKAGVVATRMLPNQDRDQLIYELLFKASTETLITQGQ
jgi:hypothetical protein